MWNTSNTSNTPIKFEALSQISSIPLVNSAISLAIGGYSRLKSYNRLISATLSGAEQSIAFVATTAKPVLEKFEKPISIADNIACQGLNKLQEKVPVINKSPEEIKDETKKLFEGSVNKIDGIRKYGTGKLQGVKEYSYGKVNGIFQSPYIKAFLNSIDTAIDLTHNAVDHYLPATDDEPVNDSKDQPLVVRMSSLSDKMRRRMYNQLSNKWIPMVALVFNNVKSNVLHWVNR